MHFSKGLFVFSVSKDNIDEAIAVKNEQIKKMLEVLISAASNNYQKRIVLMNTCCDVFML
jgi:hypothetical protein